jgi:chemotaxis protein MotB
MAKKKHVEEHENLERWLVSYADFITLLFAFFTVLYALSQQEKVKYKDAVENVQRSFLSAGGIFSLKGFPFSPFERAPDRGTPTPPSPQEKGAFSKSEDKEFIAGIEDQISGAFEDTTGMNLEPGAVEVVQSDDGVRIRLGEYLLFRPGSSKIKTENIRFMYEVGKRLKTLGVELEVEGHSDTSPHVSKEANWQLSIERAFNVVQFMVEGAKYPMDKISLSGFGDSRPIAGNDSETGRDRNRRVELVLKMPNRNGEKSAWTE